MRVQAGWRPAQLRLARGPSPHPPARAWCCASAPVAAEAPAASSSSSRPSSHRQEEAAPQALSAQQVAAAGQLTQRLRGQLILGPLTRGGNLPFRRLCAEYGAEATMSEMAFARHLLKGDRVELSRLRRAANETCFGVQIATNVIDEGVRAARLAADAGASWLDLNCGCPIHEATRRGLGAVLLRKPAKLARLVAGIAVGSPLPLTVKIRTGKNASDINAAQVVEALQGSGAAAVTIHGRTQEQRYKKAADWDLIRSVAHAASIPIIGNGDILTHYEARQRLDSGCLAVMAARGALIKPWLFEEWRTQQQLAPTARERVGIYRRLVSHMKDHFGNDDLGRRKAWYFLPWHFEWFCRYRALPEGVYGGRPLEAPLMGVRADLADPALGESAEALPLLERLLRCPAPAAHEAIAAQLWEAASDGEAAAQLEALADRELAGWEAQVAAGSRQQEEADAQG